MGVDVASFGDFFADQRIAPTEKVLPGSKADRAAPAIEITAEDANLTATSPKLQPATSRRILGKEAPVKCLVYHDPFGGTYKKYIFTADGKYLLGGMMIGDVGDFVKLVSIVKKKVNTVIKRSMTMLTFILLQKALDVPPSQFIIGAKKEGAEGGDDLDDDTQVCSCHVRFSLLPTSAFAIPVMCLSFLAPLTRHVCTLQNVSKGDIVQCVKGGTCSTIGDLKIKTKVGTGCGGCMPLVSFPYTSSQFAANPGMGS